VERGQTEGRKDRPCAIVLAVDHPDPQADGRKQVAVRADYTQPTS
jgi:hypothetical protein